MVVYSRMIICFIYTSLILKTNLITVIYLFVFEWFRKPNQNPFRPADITETVRVFVLHHFADELGTVLPEASDQGIDVLDREHDAQITERIDRG